MISPSLEVYMAKNYNFFTFGNRFVPTCTDLLPAIEIKLLGRFHPDSFKTERLVCVNQADGWTKSLHPLQVYKNINIIYYTRYS